MSTPDQERARLPQSAHADSLRRAILMIFGLSRLAVQVIASGAVVSLLVGSCVLRDRAIERKGAAKVVAKIERAADANAKKANAVRRDVQRTPADGLRDAYARD